MQLSPAFAAPPTPSTPVKLTAQNLRMNVVDMLSTDGLAPPSPSTSVNGSTTSADSAVSSPTTVTNDMLKRGWIAPFLLHLHQMLRRESTKIIRWTEDGIAFQILDKEALTEQVLPKYFKNKNFASFQRQLNYFGFRKWAKVRAEYPTYARDHFTRDNYSAMSLVKRQSKKSRKRKAFETAEETDAKRPSVQPTWTANDRCKPILPRPDAGLHIHQPQQLGSPQDVAQLALPGSISPLGKLWTAPALSSPLSISSPLSQSPIPAISSARKIQSGCKLPSLRELSASGALLASSTPRPCWLA